MTLTTILWIGLYLIFVAATDWYAYKKLNKRWKRRERPRIVVGVILVLFPAIGLGLAGVLHLFTLLVVFAGFGIAGMMTLYLDIQTEISETDHLRQEIFDDAQSDDQH